MALSIFGEHMPSLFNLINPAPTLSPALSDVLEASYTFSRMLHASKSPVGGAGGEGSGFYRAFCPVIGSQLDPTQLGASPTSLKPPRSDLTSLHLAELIKKCYRCERGEPERVGACLFPGLVKESAIDTTPLPPQTSLRANGGAPPPKKKRETRRVVVRRAQVICE